MVKLNDSLAELIIRYIPGNVLNVEPVRTTSLLATHLQYKSENHAYILHH